MSNLLWPLHFSLAQSRWRQNARRQGNADKLPQIGPFYWVKLGGRTVLKAKPFSASSGENMDHPDFWTEIVRRDIAPFYRIADQGVIGELANVPYAMERGRVAIAGRPRSATRQFAVYSWERMSESRKKQVLRAFNLGGQPVRFVPDDHEAMIEADRERFLSLLPQVKPTRA